MPIDYRRYPPDWKKTRERILNRSDNKCEFCWIKNYSIKENWTKIVITIAHLDHDEDNWSVQDERLAALCQKCHLQYDAKEKARRRLLKKSQNNTWLLNRIV